MSCVRGLIWLTLGFAGLLFVGTLPAQWRPVGPFTRVATKDLLPDLLQPGMIYAVTRVNTVLKSNDYGASWRSANTGLGVSAKELDRLDFGIDPTIPGRLYAVRGGAFFLSTDSGEHWEVGFGAGKDGPNVVSLTVVPSNPPVVYLWAEDRLWRSDDHAVTWRQNSTNLPLDIRLLAVSPGDPDTLYVSTGQIIYKSINGGMAWRRLVPNVWGATPWDDWLTILEIDEANSDIVYAGGRSLFRTTNGGISWKKVTTPPYLTGDSWIQHLQSKGSLLYSNNQVSRDGGQTWKAAFPELGLVWDLAFDPHRPGVIYMASEDGAFVSENNGSDWTDLPMPPSRVTDIITDPLAPAYLYAAASTRSDDTSEVFRGPSEGGNWQESESTISETIRLIPGVIPGQAFALSGTVHETTDEGRIWQGMIGPVGYSSVTSFAVDPQNPAVRFVGFRWRPSVFGGEYFWLAKTIDAGVSYSQLTSNDFFTKDLAIDQNDSQVLYAAVHRFVGQPGGAGFYKSTNGGMTWQESGQGLDSTSTVRVVLNPQNSSLLIVLSSTGRLFRSTDAAANWSPIGHDVGITGVTDLVLDIAQPEIIYALTNRGLVISPDAGSTWTTVDPPPAGLELTCLTVALERSRILYVGTRFDGVWRLDRRAAAQRSASRVQRRHSIAID